MNVEPTSGRAAFDRELSELARAEQSRKEFDFPLRNGRRDDGTKKRPMYVFIEGKEAMRALKRERIWNLVGGEGMSIFAAAKSVHMDVTDAGHLLREGPPPGAASYEVETKHIAEPGISSSNRRAIVDAINAAAKARGIPPLFILNCNRKSMPVVTDIRREIIMMLRPAPFEYSTLRIGRILNIDHTSVLYLLKRATLPREQDTFISIGEAASRVIERLSQSAKDESGD
jgi:hypothetical protein